MVQLVAEASHWEEPLGSSHSAAHLKDDAGGKTLSETWKMTPLHFAYEQRLDFNLPCNIKALSRDLGRL